MGRFANSLSRRLRGKGDYRPTRKVDPNVERLVSVAIKRAGEVHSFGYKAHWELRARLDPESKDYRWPVRGDVDGFLTSLDRFVTRREAETVAIVAGQLSGPLGRELLSSDLNW